MKVTLPLFFPPEGKPFGWQDPGQWDAFSAWMKENQLLENAAGPGSVVQERPAAGRRALISLPLPFGCGTIRM